MRIPKYLKNVLNTGEGSDFSIFILDAEGHKIEKKVHKLVIRQCPYFAAMLDLKGKEAKNGSVTIDNIPNDIFDYVLRYLYTTEELKDMTMEQAVKVAVAADYLQLDDLKKAALDSWKDSLPEIDSDADVLELFRELFASSLNIELDDSWRESMELLLVAMYSIDDFDVAEESDSFIDSFIYFFGKSLPCLAAHTLAEWATGDGIKLTKKQQNERKKKAAELLDKIELTDLSLRTLVILSKTEAFPALYMLKKLHERAEYHDYPVYDKVKYHLSMITSRIVELEFQDSFALFNFMGLEEDMTDDACVWELLYVPDNCDTKVKLQHATDKENPSTWPSATMRGSLDDPVEQYKCKPLGNVSFDVSLTLKEGRENSVPHEYYLTFDQD